MSASLMRIPSKRPAIIINTIQFAWHNNNFIVALALLVCEFEDRRALCKNRKHKHKPEHMYSTSAMENFHETMR